MLRFVGGSASDCAGISRRNFVQAGLLGVGGLALADLFRLQAAPAAAARKDTSVILFWLSGGPGHMETWDPKPDAVAQFRGPFGAIRTSVPGVQFGELLPETGPARGQARRPAHRQSRLRRSHQGQPLDAHRLRGAGLQRARLQGAAAAVDGLGRGQAARPQPARAAALCRRAAPARRHRQLLPLRGLPRRRRPIRSSSSPIRIRRSSASGTWPCRRNCRFGRLEDRRQVLDAMDRLRRDGERGVGRPRRSTTSGPSTC